MILVLKKNISEEQITLLRDKLTEMNLTVQIIRHERGILLSIFEDVAACPAHVFTRLPGVERILRVTPQPPLVSRARPGAIRLGNGLLIGSHNAVVIAGPCSVESRRHILEAAREVKRAGATMLRGGAFKPRTSPYDFQGLGEEGLRYLKEAKEETGLPVVSEVMSAEQVELAASYVDVLQIGARNMYNYELLKETGASGVPVLLKRGLSATINEWLNAAEYIMLQGNAKVILCERGIRTFETHTRNTLDLSAVAAVKHMSALPVVVDPSHAGGRPELVRPLTRAAIACGADGVIIEVHDQPATALSDGEQAISTEHLAEIVADIRRLEAALCDTHAEEMHTIPALPPAVSIGV